MYIQLEWLYFISELSYRVYTYVMWGHIYKFFSGINYKILRETLCKFATINFTIGIFCAVIIHHKEDYNWYHHIESRLWYTFFGLSTAWWYVVSRTKVWLYRDIHVENKFSPWDFNGRFCFGMSCQNYIICIIKNSNWLTFKILF